MFRNNKQQCQALRMLLQSVRLDYLWTDDGPVSEAFRLRDANGGPLSSGERLMLLAVFDLWNGSGNLRFSEVPGPLDARRAQRLLSLILAINIGSEAVDQWLKKESADCSLHAIGHHG